ncbi:DUF2190 domain-containing protein [Tistrella mobilis]|uniref:DUF2190 domain-containing protein n=1 Tax=Tistrella mobilis TaxID=171437 RepID=UPI0035567A6D
MSMDLYHARNYASATALSHRQIVKWGAADYTVTGATAATDQSIGVVDYPHGSDAGGRVNVQLFGAGRVVYGGAVARGDPLCADAVGRAVKATPAAGARAWIIGYAEIAGVAGDEAPVFIQPQPFIGV